MSVSRSSPLKTPSASWKATSASAVGCSWLLRTGEAFSAGTPACSASAINGEVSPSALAPGCERGEEARGVLEEGVDRRQAGVDGVERRRAFLDRFLDVGPGDAGEGGEGLVEGDEHARLLLGDRGDRRRERLERPPEAGEVGAGGDQGAQHRLTVFDQPAAARRSLRSAAGRGRPARCRSRPGSAGSPRGSACRTCRRIRRCRPVPASRRRPGSFRRPRSPSEESPGVIWRNFSPSADFGRTVIVESSGSGSALLSRLRSSSAATSPFFELDRDHRLDDADADAADPHLVAFDQRVGVRHPRLEVVGGDERQAVVGVVGEEDGDDDHQHGHRPDQDRVARQAGDSAAVPHGPRR